ncbi:heavy-metal-associated domain-containing protein [Sediminibacterium soli]|uniref:heavy-metal-associated domain-containing protein n=1 Tax=Sediminibacterium soli TaxID=2698829 RepID=UPI00137AEF51|nr:heavy-metal-associated domain-containing protein [Sediminibacterium soli]NCI46769.1 heavy-metal-associated domain-containing protein [Sediminibacterium soli]
METLQFKTNIKCSGCVAKVTPVLDELAGKNNWQVDTQAPEKTLKVTNSSLSPAALAKAVEDAGFKAEFWQ